MPEAWGVYNACSTSGVVSFSDHFFRLFGDGEKRVWWISIGRFVLQVPRFWEWFPSPPQNLDMQFLFVIVVFRCAHVSLIYIHNVKN